MIWPAALVALLFRVIISFRMFTPIWVLTKGGPGSATEVLAIYLYRRAFSYWAFGEGAALSVILLAITVIGSFYIIRKMYKG